MENKLAAQYLRVSTERQEYSIGFQSAGIATYAQEHNFTVRETYIDEAKSGLEIKHRKGSLSTTSGCPRGETSVQDHPRL
jgi:DNA invertase Pin-like site-specific DNA recombinase